MSKGEYMENEDELMLESLNIKDGRVDMKVSGEQMNVFFNWLIQLFKDFGGDNFVCFTIGQDDKKYSITVQDCTKSLTPAEKMEAMQKEIDELKRRLKEK
jgi:hypothetical protein